MNWTKSDLEKKGLVWSDELQKFVKKPLSIAKPITAPASTYQGQIWIPGNVPSLKNSKQIFFRYTDKPMNKSVRCTMNGKPAVPFISSSKLVKEYQTATKRYYAAYRETFLKLINGMPAPYIVEFVFVRSSKRTFDFNNGNHICTDMMKAAEWFPDDDTTYILPIPKLTAPHFFINSKGPGVWINLYKPN